MKKHILAVSLFVLAGAALPRMAFADATANVTNLINRLDPLTANVLSNFVMLTDIPRPTYHELLGVVAQRYPWNGWLDIQYRTPYANEYIVVSFYANGEYLGEAMGTCGQSATVSFDLNTVAGGAFRNKQLKSVKITAKIQ